MNIILVGSSGKMGKMIAQCVSSSNKIVACVNSGNAKEFFAQNKKLGDVIIDFSSHSLAFDLCKYATVTNTPLLVGTTGHTDAELSAFKKASNTIPVFVSGNFSVGIALIMQGLKSFLQAFPFAKVQIYETHHINKVDIPSGTALMLGLAAAKITHGKIVFDKNIDCVQSSIDDINIHSKRVGDVVGFHRIEISTSNEKIVFEHNAFNREIFALGALKCAEYLVRKSNGFYSMDDFMGECV